MPAVVQAIEQGARLLAGAVAEPAVALQAPRADRRSLQRALPIWLHGMTTLLRAALATGTVVADAARRPAGRRGANRPAPS